MPTDKQLQEMVALLWKAQQSMHGQLAEMVFKRNNLPPAAPVLIAGLDQLLADLQKTAFMHGASAALIMLVEESRPEEKGLEKETGRVSFSNPTAKPS